MECDPETGHYDEPEQEEPPMKTPADSFVLRGPFRGGPNNKQWLYEILEDGEIVADAYGKTQQAALEIALLISAAPLMADVLEDVTANMSLEDFRIPKRLAANAYMESQGILCTQCDTLGQPSRMVMSPTNRPYHETCVPDDVKKAIAEEGKAADNDDVPY